MLLISHPRRTVSLFAWAATLALVHRAAVAQTIADSAPTPPARAQLESPIAIGAVVHQPTGPGGGPEGSCPETLLSHTQTPFDVGSNVNAQGGFLETEWAAAQYNIPTTEFPIRIVLAEILFAAPSINANSHTEWSVGFWQGDPRTGSQVRLESSDDLVLPHLQHPIGNNVAAVIQFSVQPGEGADIIIEAADPGAPTNSFSVGFRVDLHNLQIPYCIAGFCDVACNPNDPFCGNLCYGNNMMPATDVDATPDQNNLNWLFGSTCGGACFTGWKKFSEITQACRPTGDWMIRVTYTSANCANAPVVNAVNPNSATNTGVVHLTISGSNFGGGSPAAQLTQTGQPPILGTNIVVTPDGTTLEGDFNLTGAAAGLRNVVVATIDGTGQLDDGFEITLPQPPQIFNVAPGNENNNVVLLATVTGSHFVDGATSLTLNGPATIPATNVDVDSEANLTCQFDLRCQPTGSYSCTVTTPYGNATLGSAVTVGALPAPTVFAADVSATTNCPGSLTLNVFGLEFQNGASARLVRNGSPDVIATNVVFNDATSITATFNTAQLATGSYNLRVANPDCQSSTTDPGAWSLTVSACIPTISSITPNSTNNHQSTVNITNLAGGNFVTGATVKLTRAGQSDIVATNVVVVSAVSITCTVNPFLAQTGAWSVVVTNPGGGTGTLNNGFTINPGPLPVVSTVISNNSGPPDNCDPWNGRVLGSNYLNGATVRLTLSGQPDIVGTNVVWVSSSQLTATFNLTGVATTPGADKWDCVVTNPDTQVGTGLDKVDVTPCAGGCLKADVNVDGQRDGRDISRFVQVLLTQSGTPTEICAADLAAPNGVVDNADIPPFVNCLVNGACP